MKKRRSDGGWYFCRVDDPYTLNDMRPWLRNALLDWIELRCRKQQRVSVNFQTNTMLAAMAKKEIEDEHKLKTVITDNQMKCAMLAAGFRPSNPGEHDWVYYIKPIPMGDDSLFDK